MTTWRPPKAAVLALALGLSCLLGGEKEGGRADAPEAAAAAVPSASAPAPAPTAEAPRAPDIIVDPANIAVGRDRIATGEVNLDDRLAALVKAQPAVAGQSIDFVAMRASKPSQVASVVNALRKAGASGAAVKTESRAGATVRLALSFSTKLADCAAVAWITKDGAIDVWPAGGATAKRINKGLAGPDMTLGSEAVVQQASGCAAPELVVGGDDRFPWGLVFDLATTATTAHGSRLSVAVLTTDAVPGRKLKLE
jgi:hypothetical protein